MPHILGCTYRRQTLEKPRSLIVLSFEPLAQVLSEQREELSLVEVGLSHQYHRLQPLRILSLLEMTQRAATVHALRDWIHAIELYACGLSCVKLDMHCWPIL